MLGDFGADVVKLETPSGDPMRGLGARRGGHSVTWAMVSRNKRSLRIDLDGEAGTALFHRLVEAADVLVENHPRPVLERWRATWPELSARNPRLVMVSVSGFGATGPYRDRPGAGTVAEAFGGLTHMTGEQDGPPLLSSLPIGDTLAAVSGVVGALAACYERDARGGAGQHVDVSLYEPVLQLLAGTIVSHDPGAPPPGRTGSRIAGGAPRNVYRTRDERHVALSATTDSQVARILRVIGSDTEEARERFGRARRRLENADALDALVGGWIAARTREEALGIFLAERIPAAPVNDLEDLAADPHVRARESLVEVEDGELGKLAMVAPVPRLRATPGAIRSTGPALGAHSREVLREWLSIDVAELDALRDRGVI